MRYSKSTLRDICDRALIPGCSSARVALKLGQGRTNAYAEYIDPTLNEVPAYAEYIRSTLDEVGAYTKHMSKIYFKNIFFEAYPIVCWGTQFA